MSFRRFVMHDYHQVLSSMRLGETNRAISRAGIMGRRNAAELRSTALNHGWLDPNKPLPTCRFSE